MFLARFSPKRRAALQEALQPAPQHELRELARRAVARNIVDFHTVVAIEGLGAFDARLMDISPYGCQVRTVSRTIARDERVWVLLPMLGEVEALAMWGLKGLFGCKFVEPVDAAQYAELLPQLQGTHPGLADRE